MKKNFVAKFGGTSVKTASAIKNVTHIISSNKDIKVVVVSAVGGITNLLMDFYKGNLEQQTIIAEKIRSIHIDLIKELGLSLEGKIIEVLERLWQSKKYDAESLDSILSIGEDLSSLIVNAYFQSQGHNSTLLDARLFMVTDSNFGKAIPLIERITSYPFPDQLFVTQGFIGRSEEGMTTTLGRGGSDYSAALIAEAIGADELFIYTDVPGVYTSDPNHISSAMPITSLTFQEMAEMANFGAKILHPATLEPCVRSKIPIRILSTFEPEKEGTLVRMSNITLLKESYITAVTMRSNQFLVTIKSSNMLNNHGFLANIFTILAGHKISIDLITTSEVSVALTVDNANIGHHVANPFIKNGNLLEELQQFAEITVEDNLTLVAIIGYSLTIPGVIQKILKIIGPYKIRLVCYGASNSSIGLLVPKDSAKEMASLLHRELLEVAHV